MAIKTTKGKYKCFFCKKEYDKEQKADECVVNHNLIYLPMTHDEMNQLVMYIYDLRDPPMQLIWRIKEIQRREGR